MLENGIIIKAFDKVKAALLTLNMSLFVRKYRERENDEQGKTDDPI
jgi:hypothetical protein